MPVTAKNESAASLKRLCMDKYLENLESACYAYIQLSVVDSPFLRSMVKNILPTLKHHLETQLPSVVIRTEMLRDVFS